MSNIFISYRRSDSAPYAGRLYDRLSGHFGEPQVFMDLEIEPGEDFVDRLETGVGQCEVLLVIIGPNWLGATDEGGHRRLDDAEDFARIEVVAALERAIRVIPVLVGGAAMPDAGDLPPDLAPLGRRQALELTDARFRDDTDRLIEVIEAELGTRAATAEVSRDPAPRETPGPRAEPRRRPAWLMPALAVLLIAIAASAVLIGGSGDDDDEPGSTADTGRADVVVSGPPSTPQIAPNPLHLPRERSFSLVNATGAAVRINAGDQQTQFIAGSQAIPPLGSGAYVLSPDQLVTVSLSNPLLDQASLEFTAGEAVATLQIDLLD